MFAVGVVVLAVLSVTAAAAVPPSAVTVFAAAGAVRADGQHYCHCDACELRHRFVAVVIVASRTKLHRENSRRVRCRLRLQCRLVVM